MSEPQAYPTKMVTAKTLTLHWHDNSLPVYSVDFQPNIEGKRSQRLATGGGDGNVRIWKLIYSNDPKSGESETVESVEYLSTLGKHAQAVNCVRFDHRGQYLASASDDGSVIVWELSDQIIHELGVEDEYLKESWRLKTIAFSPSRSEIYDISWSPDSKFICTGSMDNVVRIFDAESGMMIQQIKDHNHYVQGVTWDPLNKFIASQSADRSVHIYNIRSNIGHDLKLSKRSSHRISRSELPTKPLNSSGPPPDYKTCWLYYNETLQSFFRRLTFSPDGSLLLTPSGIYKIPNSNEKPINTIYVHTRSGLNQSPVLSIPGFKRPAIAIRFSPVLYKLRSGISSCMKLPYRMIFAVATQDSVVIFDTQTFTALAIIGNIHYAVIADICWSSDGKVLMASSADGFVSSMVFDDKLLGEVETYDIQTYLKGKNGRNFGQVKLESEGNRSTPVSSSPVKPSIVEMLGGSSTTKKKETKQIIGMTKDGKKIEEDDEVVYVSDTDPRSSQQHIEPPALV